MNLSTPQPEEWGLPSIRAQVEGLEVHPEPRSFIPLSMVGLRAAERVKTHRKYEGSSPPTGRGFREM
jgi:hypothetical protein